MGTPLVASGEPSFANLVVCTPRCHKIGYHKIAKIAKETMQTTDDPVRNCIQAFSNHPSILRIKGMVNVREKFVFSHVDPSLRIIMAVKRTLSASKVKLIKIVVACLLALIHTSFGKCYRKGTLLELYYGDLHYQEDYFTSSPHTSLVIGSSHVGLRQWPKSKTRYF